MNEHLISKEYLLHKDFNIDEHGNYWMDLQTHALELIEVNGIYYPVIVEFPEMSSEEEQRVSLKSIQLITDLNNILSMIN